MKPILISGIQPSGKLHLGNYLGALKHFVELQNSGKYRCFFFIADLHSLTGEYAPKEKTAQIADLMRSYLAAGLSPVKSTLFLQSSIPAHSELAWILNTITPMGELRRMTQFKDKASDMAKSKSGKVYEISVHENAMDHWKSLIDPNVGLFNYPVLMAADVLLYDAGAVPVGDDQDQHLELTRTLARKFNSRFGKTFIEPKSLHTAVPRLMSLDDPTKKMSKSRPAGCLFMDDLPLVIREKLAHATTDSGHEVKYDEKNKPGISNLLTIYSALTDEALQLTVARYKDKGYADFKRAVADVVVKALAPYQAAKKKLSSPTAKAAFAKGNKAAMVIAENKMVEVKKKIGLI
ncbi:MAG: tryptophan--tRNA ligase [Candidatus Brennerbacteria bacterium]